MKQTIRGSHLPGFLRLSPILAFSALLGLAGCATHVQNTGNYVAPTQPGALPAPRPRAVLVYGFTIDPNTVKLDSGVLAKLNSAPDPQAKRRQLAYQITSTISETLVDAFNRMGLAAYPAGPGAAPQPGDVLVEGQITQVSAGNSARRAVIGFGAGASRIDANVQVLRAGPGGAVQPLQTYDATANSGHTPGLALGAAGAAAGHVAVAAAGAAAGTVERQRTGLAKDAEDLAKKVATNIGNFFAAQGWISPQ